MAYYSMYGAAAAMVFVAGVGAYAMIDRSANYEPVKASVYLIDRKCRILETETSSSERTKRVRSYNDDCNSIDEWDTVREKRNKTVDGKAVIHVTYTAPQDGRTHTSELNYDGRDDEFYELKAGDEIDVLVSNSNLDKVIKG